MRESSLAAVMLRRVAASRPSRDWCPSFSIPERPAAVFRFMDVMLMVLVLVCVVGWCEV